MLSAEFKKIRFSKETKVMIALVIFAYLIPLMYVINFAIGSGFNMNDYNGHLEIMCKALVNGAETELVTNENVFGYLLGFNDWGRPEFYEIFRTAMFSNMLLTVIFVVYTINIFYNEFLHLTFRQEVFYGIAPIKALSYKFIANVFIELAIYIVGITASYFAICVLLGYSGTFDNFVEYQFASLLNMVCVLACESVVVLLIAVFRKRAAIIGIALVWILSDYVFYLGCIDDIWALGKPLGILLISNPVTYMYKINNYGQGIGCNIFSETMIVCLLLIFVSWLSLNWYFRKREI